VPKELERENGRFSTVDGRSRRGTTFSGSGHEAGGLEVFLMEVVCMKSLKHFYFFLLILITVGSAFAQDDLAKIKSAGVFRIGSEGTYSPFTYHDASGTLVGFDVEIGQEVARRLGVKSQFTDGKWDGLIAGLDANRYDAVINEVTITDARKAKYDFSDPYVVTKPVLITKSGNSSIKSFADLKGKIVVEDLSSTYAKTARDLGAQVVSADLPFDVVLSGRADATINDRLYFLDYKKQKPDVALGIVVASDSSDYQGIIVRKSKTRALVIAINKALADIKADGTYQKLCLKYFGEDVSK
jgi:cystine transport system substrate-binding protein